MTKLKLKAQRFYKKECEGDPSKRQGILYIHNLIDEYNQEWIAKFRDGQFVEVSRAKIK